MAPSTGVKKGIVVDIDATVRAIRESVEAAERAGGVQIGSVYVGITGEHITSLNSRGVVAVTSADREIHEEHVTRVQEAARVIVLPPDREILHNLPRDVHRRRPGRRPASHRHVGPAAGGGDARGDGGDLLH